MRTGNRSGMILMVLSLGCLALILQSSSGLAQVQIPVQRPLPPVRSKYLGDSKLGDLIVEVRFPFRIRRDVRQTPAFPTGPDV